jgi:DtxR family Mn-dependent transcriptional regulator
MLQQQMERVSTNALADALNILPPSVTDMARRMAKAGLVDYRKYYGVVLTEEGERVALQVIRRHRLIELYLVRELGYGLHEVHTEADRLEHAVSDYFVEALATKLGNPQFDPHGDPIPTSEGSIARRELVALAELPLDTPATISRFIAEENDMLEHIIERGFRLDAKIAVIARDPFDGPITVRVNGDQLIIGHNVATSILVQPS